MAGKLTTHVLDTSIGRPAGALRIELWKYNAELGNYEKVVEAETNEDGRIDSPLLEAESMQRGSYELLFHVADYFNQMNVNQEEPPFLNVVPVSFGISDQESHYHIPLLIAPGGYSTYRGS